MSEDKLYMETGELPPQGIGPEKSGIKSYEVCNQWVDGVIAEDDTYLHVDIKLRDPEAYYKNGEIRGVSFYTMMEVLYALDCDPEITFHLVLHAPKKGNYQLENAESIFHRGPAVDWLLNALKEDLTDLPIIRSFRTPATNEQEGVGHED